MARLLAAQRRHARPEEVVEEEGEEDEGPWGRSAASPQTAPAAR